MVVLVVVLVLVLVVVDVDVLVLVLVDVVVLVVVDVVVLVVVLVLVEVDVVTTHESHMTGQGIVEALINGRSESQKRCGTAITDTPSTMISPPSKPHCGGSILPLHVAVDVEVEVDVLVVVLVVDDVDVEVLVVVTQVPQVARQSSKEVVLSQALLN